MFSFVVRFILLIFVTFFFRDLFSYEFPEMIIEHLIAVEGGPDKVQRTLQDDKIENSMMSSEVVTITSEQDFERLLLLSRASNRALVLCVFSSDHKKKSIIGKQTEEMKESLGKIASGGQLSMLLYGMMDVSGKNASNVKVLERILQLTGISKDQGQLPLTLFLAGDRLILPINSGYLSYEHFMNFILSKIAR